MRAFSLRRVSAWELPEMRRLPIDQGIMSEVARIVDDVRSRGEAALRQHAVRFGDLEWDDPLIRGRAELEAAFQSLPPEERALLERTAARIRAFAEAQRSCLRELVAPVPGGRAGHHVRPLKRAGCYAPGGRFPLPSSVLMTAVPARVAGVQTVLVASPRPTPIVLAAVCVAGADALLAAGGAQAIAALAFGAGPIPPCEIVVGPGNRWVTAAKQLVASQVAIDMLAGPSELVVVADESADAALAAADLLAQAEHDPEALPILVALHPPVVDAVEQALREQLAGLSTAAIAQAALENGFAILVSDLEEAAAVCDRLAPEHLELFVRDPQNASARFRNYGALFIGSAAGEVLGDYGAGPNHVLPTGGTARTAGGLSVLSFLKITAWLEIQDPEAARALALDARNLARLEGLEAHARAAERRIAGSVARR